MTHRSDISDVTKRHSGPAAARPRRGTFWITVIAASTGGPAALGRVIPLLPADYPTPVLVVQHMPPVFTALLAQSLDIRSALPVFEATHGMALARGHVYLAPGGRHLVVRRDQGFVRTGLDDGPTECGVRPATDVLLRSLAHLATPSPALVAVLTGMGHDGREGLRLFAPRRRHCLVQSADTCVVNGMPGALVEAGLADEVLPLDGIAGRLADLAAAPLVNSR